MKTEKKGVEGQLDIFEAMNRAADAIDRMHHIVDAKSLGADGAGKK